MLCNAGTTALCIFHVWSWITSAGRTAAVFCMICKICSANESCLCQCAAGRSTIVTMAAVQRSGGVNVAVVGLTNMMNAGGAVKDFQLSGDSSRNGSSSDASASVQVGHR